MHQNVRATQFTIHRSHSDDVHVKASGPVACSLGLRPQAWHSRIPSRRLARPPSNDVPALVRLGPVLPSHQLCDRPQARPRARPQPPTSA